jgi:hypothetical protein
LDIGMHEAGAVAERDVLSGRLRGEARADERSEQTQ